MTFLAWLIAVALALSAARRYLCWAASCLPGRPCAPTRTSTVTVLVAARNEAHLLPRLLDALDRLDYPRHLLSFVLASDESSDGTPRLMEEWCAARQGARFLCLSERAGKGGALASAFQVAPESDLVMVVDADTEPRPNALSCMAGAFADPKVGAACGYLEPSNSGVSLVSRYAALERWVFHLVTLRGKDRLALNPQVVGGLFLVRRKALIEIGGFPVCAASEDVRLSMELTRKGWKTRWVGAAVAREDVPEQLDDFVRQRSRWTRGLLDSHGLARTVEDAFVVAGYLDRLLFAAVLALVFWGPIPAWLPALYALAPVVAILTAVARARAGRKALCLAALPVMVVADVCVTAASTFSQMAGAPIHWSHRRKAAGLEAAERKARTRGAWPVPLGGLLLLVAILIQLHHGQVILGSDLASPDPPAHFVTGVLLHDYVKRGAPSAPMAFAECFYVRYPKVAFGHWPPVFYLLECAWFLCFGATVTAARVLCAAVAAVFAAVIWGYGRRYWNQASGLSAASVFLVYPYLQTQAWQVMSDILLALFAFLALMQLGRWLSGAGARSIWWCALWSVLAILTKGTGWLLLPVALAAPLVARRSPACRERSYWLAMLAVVAGCAPFFLVMSHLGLGYPAGVTRQLQMFAETGLWGRPLWWAAVAPATVWLSWRFRSRPPVSSTLAMCLCLGLWLTAQLVFKTLFPEIAADWKRFSIPAVAPALFLIVAGLSRLEQQLAVRALPAGSLAALFGCAALACSGIATQAPVTGYSAAVDNLAQREGSVIWVQSDPSGEGAIVARWLEKDRARSGYVVRGSKLLSSSTWSGFDYTLRYHRQEEVRDLLERIPVHSVLVDTTAEVKPDTELLLAALTAPESPFVLRSSYPVHRAAGTGELRIYERQSLVRAGPIDLTVILSPERGDREVACRAQ